LLCGGFALSETLTTGLARLLPDVLRLDSATGGLSRWLAPIFGIVREEADEPEAGQAAVFAKIADVFLTQILRSYVVGAEQAGLLQLTPLRDPTIAGAVDLLRSRAHEPWTVAALAREIGMSRTTFTARFRDVVGETPIRYLTKVRLGQGAGYLATTTWNLHTIARHCGYDSEASFSKAFKREFGQSPGDYRNRVLASPIVRERGSIVGAGQAEARLIDPAAIEIRSANR
jgi:AraC-like DNA-binding protein